MCSENVQLSLCDLPHYTLSILLSYLDSSSLYMLSQTCTYLRDFVENPRYWKYIDARSAPNSYPKFLYCVGKVWEQTTHLLLRGNETYNTPKTFFTTVMPFLNLKILALEHQRIVGRKISMRDYFPTGLEELSLKGTYIENKHFFQQSWYKFPKLKVLILDECGWLRCDALMSLSRYENLEIISVVKCPKIHIDTVPYSNIAKYGFKKLKIFDGRFTGIGGELLRTFYGHESIQRFYFQSFNSAVIDYGPDCEGSIKKIFKGIGSCHNISDYNLRDYKSTEPLEEVENVFDSFLYRDPYPSCTCGGREDKDLEDILDLPVLKDDCLDNYFDSDDVKFVCKKHREEMENLPQDVRDILIKSQRLDLDSTKDNDSDSGEDDSNCCCLHGMDTKVIILSNISNLTTISIPDSSTQRSSNPNIIYFHFGNSRNRANRNRVNNETDNNRPSTSQNMDTNSSESVGENSSSQRSLEVPSTSRSELERNDSIETEPKPVGHRINNESATTNNSKRKSNLKPSEVWKQLLSKRKKIIDCEPSTSSSSASVVKSANENSDDSNEGNMDVKHSSDNILLNESRPSEVPSVSRSGLDDNNPIEMQPQQLENSINNAPGNANNAKRKCEKPRTAFPYLLSKRKKVTDCEPSTSSSSVSVVENANKNPDDNSDHELSEEEEEYINEHIAISVSRDLQPANLQLPNETVEQPELQQNAEPHPRRRQRKRHPYKQFPHHYALGDAIRFLRERVPANGVKKKISLNRVSLRGYRKVTDFSLDYLRHLNIELLDLTYTGCTKAGIENFLLYNPNCRIVHPLYCICKPRSPF